ncbi:uncharacterized protein STEHIDRAFT_67962 [Stereum hirsutum FP-91666 SS1]|uniref:uncharacterized protein n=1 Tax=Stereum hirsutum (strain FP-91666) TaxID=721885 RepID=UPI0004449FCB|nr:uncharacterized protein STEHIDRAFT_67962 [Stereum hirsutum FP-91666 SS1]EIM80572.1 hypothetical protein STEHIDRAFT_67962 [Stereum hirsutum FP-91666 SS1]
MNSYPPELLVQLAPVMFVAGLDVPNPNPATPSTEPEIIVASPSPTPPSVRPQQDPFTILILRLRDALNAQRKVAVWQPEKAKTFQVVLAVNFPPRKLIPPDADVHHSTVAHSPLSPLTPSSPLHPDGLIAPIWIRKHTALVPSVFVLFIRLYETPAQGPRSPLDIVDPEREREREQEERRKDADLSAEVALRKKATNERGIKLTVVLIASRKMLDDPALDARLTFIRRQSGLDSRAALFVLSPVSPAELSDFVKSLQQALYEPAVDYYTNHSKRVRRKRNRHTQATSSYVGLISPASVANIARPLRPEGWTVRYEYKMACFAEFRGEDEVALKHYQDSYSTLVIMFGSTAILPPRTKRWAEAKVLADCINIKICKLYLYNNEHALALSQHTIHMRKFGDFSRGWGIGEDTFEFWSWIARQHRVFAELLEQGTRSTLIIPSHLPLTTASSSASSLAAASSALEVDAMRVLGLNPSHALQHPGFSYYMAARATEKRRERLMAMIETVITSEQNLNNSPGFANERKVDHLTIILELFTKSYELFKKYSLPNGQGQGRLTLRIAYRIAQTYYEAGKFDMAVRFFERIARTYRREKWGSMLRPLLSTWYACAQQLGDVELSVKLLVEMLAHGMAFSSDEEEGAAEEDLLAVLKSTVPSSPDEPLVVDLSDSESIFTSTTVFWDSETSVDVPSAFQISLNPPSSVSLSNLAFSSLAITFSHDERPLVITHSDDHSTEGALSEDLTRVIRVGTISPTSDTLGPEDVKANLRWGRGTTVVISGTVMSNIPTTLNVSNIVLTLQESAWRIEIPIQPTSTSEGKPKTPQWLASVDPARFVPVRREHCHELLIRHRPHLLQVALKHYAPAFLDEQYPIVIDVTNVDTRPLDVVLDVLLQPTEIDEAVNDIRIDEERSSGLIKGIALGIVPPGVSVLKTLYLHNTGAPGDRILDISIQSRFTPSSLASTPDTVPPSPLSPSDDHRDTTETLETLVIPTTEAMKLSYDVKYMSTGTETRMAGLMDLEAYVDEYWDDRDGGVACVEARMECVGPWSLSVEKVRLVRKPGPHAKVLDCSVDEDEDEIASDWLPGDEFAAICRISLAPEDEPGEDDAIAGPGEYELSWRRVLPNGEHGPLCISTFPLPILQPPLGGLVALLSIPSSAKLHRPFQASLTIRNHHPTRTATVSVQLEPDATTDAFLVAGLRSGRIPILMPGAEEKLTWTFIPVECGFVRIPKMFVTDKRLAEPRSEDVLKAPSQDEVGKPVRIIDTRREWRDQEDVQGAYGTVNELQDILGGRAPGGESMSGIEPILVLP